MQPFLSSAPSSHSPFLMGIRGYPSGKIWYFNVLVFSWNKKVHFPLLTFYVCPISGISKMHFSSPQFLWTPLMTGNAAVGCYNPSFICLVAYCLQSKMNSFVEHCMCDAFESQFSQSLCVLQNSLLTSVAYLRGDSPPPLLVWQINLPILFKKCEIWLVYYQ